MHELGYLGRDLNRAANGSHLYEPQAKVNMSEILVSRPEDVTATAALHNLLGVQILKACIPENGRDPMYDPDYYPFQHCTDTYTLDGYWDIFGDVAVNGMSLPYHLLGGPAPITLHIMPGEQNPWNDKILIEYELLDVTPGEVIHYQTSLQVDDMEYFADRGRSRTLTEDETWGLWLDLSIAINAPKPLKDPSLQEGIKIFPRIEGRLDD